MSEPQARVSSLALSDGIVVHALFDGGLAGVLPDYKGLPSERLAAMLEAAGKEVPPRPDLTCFLIEAGARRILVDAGAGLDLGPGAGALPRSLALIGIEPAAIDTVFLTHLHGDHVAGLTASNGKPIFHNAGILMHSKEFRFWITDRPQRPTSRRASQDAIIERSLAPYCERLSVVDDGPLLPAIAVHLLPGHTAGHSGLIVGEGESDRLFIVGDILHLPEIQLPHPEVTTVYDWDEGLAAATRQRALEMAEREEMIVAGMHFRWPTFSRAVRHDGQFALAPVRPAA